MKDLGKSDLAHPHDLLVRTVLADPDIAGDLFRNYLDPAIAETIDFDSLKREGADTVSPGLSRLVGDLRYSAKFKDSADKLDVFVFLEHQSRPDPFIAFRMAEYVIGKYRQQFSALQKGEPFPYPLPVVLHHGRRPWKKIPQMRDLIAMRSGLPSDILNLPISLIDAATMQLDDLPGHPMVAALLDSLQSASTGRLPQRTTGIFSRLRNVIGEARLKGWATSLATYYLAVQGGARKNLDALSQALQILYSPQETRNMTLTFAQSWIKEGETKGRAEGKAEAVASVLKSRFGTTPATVQKKLMNQTDASRIEEMLELAATCSSLKEFQSAL